MWKQKYKKTIDSIYPEPPETEISKSNVGKLTYYCQRTPDKLPKVASELRKREQAALKKRDILRTIQTVQIFQNVVTSCPEFLSMCEDDLGEILSNLCSDPAPELRSLAADLFISYADAVSQTTAANSRMDFNLFVRSFTTCATTTLDTSSSAPVGPNNVPLSVTLRAKGFRALRSSARVLELRGALDDYVKRNGKEIASAIISSVRLAPSVLLQFASLVADPATTANNGDEGAGKGESGKKDRKGNDGDDADGDEGTGASTETGAAATAAADTAASSGAGAQSVTAAFTANGPVPEYIEAVATLALQFLQDVTKRLTTVMITSFVSDFASLLIRDSALKTEPIELQCAMLVAIRHSLRTNDRQLFIAGIVREMERTDEPRLQLRLAQCIARVYTDNSGPVGEVISACIKLTSASLTSQFSDEAPDITELRSIREDATKAVGTLAHNIGDSMVKTAAVVEFITKVDSVSKKLENTTAAGKDSGQVAGPFVQMAAEVAATISRPTKMPLTNTEFMSALLHFVEHKTPTVRRAALDVLAAVVSGGRCATLLDALDESPEHICQASEMLAHETGDTANLISQSAAIRKSVLSVLGAKTNTPYHVWACWRVLAFMLLRLRENDLMFTLPQLFAMQNVLAGGASPHNTARWTVLVGYLRIASSIFRLPELRTLAKNAWQDSRSKGTICTELAFHGELIICKKPLKWQPKSKTAEGAALSVIVPRDKVTELLSGVAIIKNNYPEVEAILRGEAEPKLPVPAAVVPSPDIPGSSATPQPSASSVASRAMRSISLVNPPPLVVVHDALRYEALINAIVEGRTASPVDKSKEKKPLSFTELMSAAQQYRQDTEKQQKEGLAQSTRVASSSSSSAPPSAATAAAVTAGVEEEKEEEKKEGVTDSERFATEITALASGEENKSTKCNVDWNVYVAEKQRWPRVPQLPLF